MLYRILIRAKGEWQEVGFSHTTVKGARDDARSHWRGYQYLIVPIREQ